MQTTYRDLITFLTTANNWLAAPAHQADTKFRWGLHKVAKAADKLLSDYRDKVADTERDHAAEDEKSKVILRNERGGVEFTKAGQTTRDAEVRVLFESPVEIAPYMAKNPPKDLTGVEREAFAGFVLPARDEEPEGE